MRFEEKSPFRSGQEGNEQEQEVIASAIALLCDVVDAVDVVVGEMNTNGCWILWIPTYKLNVIHK